MSDTRDSKVGMGFGAGAHCELTGIAEGKTPAAQRSLRGGLPHPAPPPRLSAGFRARLGVGDAGAVAAALARGRSAHKPGERSRGHERMGRVEMERPRSANRLVHASPRPWEAAACRRRQGIDGSLGKAPDTASPGCAVLSRRREPPDVI